MGKKEQELLFKIITFKKELQRGVRVEFLLNFTAVVLEKMIHTMVFFSVEMLNVRKELLQEFVINGGEMEKLVGKDIEEHHSESLKI